VASPLTVSGNGAGYEATIVASVLERFRPDPALAKAPTIAGGPDQPGNGDTPAPYSVTLTFSKPTAIYGAVLVHNTSGLENAIPDFSVVLVQLK
jgi:hypothetical protein